MLYSLLVQTVTRSEVEEVPRHIAFIADDADAVECFFSLCDDFGVEKATACVAGPEGDKTAVATDGGVAVVSAEEYTDRTVVPTSGRDGFAEAVRNLSEEVEEGELSPDDIGHDEVEDALQVGSEPDLVINARGGGLADYLLWQTVYSELCYVDSLDRDTFADCLREYAERERRYGR